MFGSWGMLLFLATLVLPGGLAHAAKIVQPAGGTAVEIPEAIAIAGQLPAADQAVDPNKPAAVDKQDAPLDADPAKPPGNVINGARVATKVDAKLFEEAAKRRKERREQALEMRRMINGQKVHVYALGRSIQVPGPFGPFNAQRDYNFGGSPSALRARSGGRRAVGFVADSGRGMDVEDLIALQSNFPEAAEMKILFLCSEDSGPNGPKPSYLRANGHIVVSPNMNDDFASIVAAAEEAYAALSPHVIVGDLRGAAVAMAMDRQNTPVLLMRPSWRRWGVAAKVPENTLIMHSSLDREVPLGDSIELRDSSLMPASSLIEIGEEDLSDDASLRVMLRACELLAQ